MLGTPNEETWPDLTTLPDYKPFPQYHPTQGLAQVTPKLTSRGKDLLQVNLVYSRLSTVKYYNMYIYNAKHLGDAYKMHYRDSDAMVKLTLR